MPDTTTRHSGAGHRGHWSMIGAITGGLLLIGGGTALALDSDETPPPSGYLIVEDGRGGTEDSAGDGPVRISTGSITSDSTDCPDAPADSSNATTGSDL